MPDKPEAWLLTTARRRLIDRARHDRVRADAANTIRLLMDELVRGGREGGGAFPDERLKLLFVCAHPDIDRGMHTPLMLQVVLGLDAATIASAFLTSPAAMGQRLSRAKARIRDAGLAFEIPDRRELPARLDAVLDAIYAAYGSGWDDVAGSDPRRGGTGARSDLAGADARAAHAGRAGGEGPAGADVVLRSAAPGPAKRRTAATCRCRGRTRGCGPRRCWTKRSGSWRAAAARRAGRFQLEAALQSAHVEGTRRGRTDWGAIAVLYEGLVRRSPTVGAFVGRAAAIAEAEGPAAGHSTRSIGSIRRRQQSLSTVLGRARASPAPRRTRRRTLRRYERAIGLTEDAATRQFLLRRRAEAEATSSREVQSSESDAWISRRSRMGAGLS